MKGVRSYGHAAYVVVVAVFLVGKIKQTTVIISINQLYIYIEWNEGILKYQKVEILQVG